ncbi:hypothetical protein FHT87_005160 [Rhizobium sp. BK316]|uniref:hypothetical protein n=1 Tax=Rhizobium sp. BK316 TaxID=2587053 RepID=UPI001613AC8D|nr:hypothetical protein [Rhizobium sp. BK316]MBB3411207.1 hypothetical protein [Rhizobium sp. BK316]
MVLGDISPEIRFFRSGNAADQKYWRLLPTTTTFNIQAASDADPTTGQVGYSMVRSGATVTQHVFLTGAAARLAISDTDIAAAAGYAPANPASLATKQYVDTAVGGGLALASGTYTPSVLFTNNASVGFVGLFYYQRVGNVVNVTGRFSATVTNNASSASIRFSVPVSTSFTTGNQATGFGTTVLNPVAAGQFSVISFAGDNSASLTLWSANTSSNDYGINFSYTVQ